MTVNIDQWRAGIGRFQCCIVIPKTRIKLSDPITISSACLHFSIMYFYLSSFLRLEISKINSRPNQILIHIFFCCHWNVNNFATDNYSKVLALKVFKSAYKYDFICISETFFDSSFELDDKDIMLDAYNLI